MSRIGARRAIRASRPFDREDRTYSEGFPPCAYSELCAPLGIGTLLYVLTSRLNPGSSLVREGLCSTSGDSKCCDQSAPASAGQVPIGAAIPSSLNVNRHGSARVNIRLVRRFE